MRLTLASWNLHRGISNGGRRDCAPFFAALEREICAPPPDLLLLQEADVDPPPHHGVLDPGRVEALTGLRHLHAGRERRLTDESHGFLGLVAYAAPDIEVEGMRLIDLPGRVPRGAVVIDAARGGAPFRIVLTHLSLAQWLRAVQMRTLGQHIARSDPRPVILCGDLNEWRPWGGLALSAAIVGRRLAGPARASFPTRRPLLPLDRVLTEPPGAVERLEVLDGPAIRRASDHRPLRARVRLGPATSSGTRRLS
ncbi:endonuclease/exonuclease/phosphatase family protein [Jannaschia seohaensis]|uniref:Endonuclease/exonuclease/phosphatase family metal-dependent hydrolase n=1 Tax=Jannaschia seohaensis TaxID=475081 RepID=A0A2Y9C402_9RHOB|nr:endonuclease/exonuclease/phosphatase family protein [Jannaschia seohaensis]PWJ22445.1 endonuclease/exonuclease/phosphatase family metal-dependent hydrolase [Jannaschia seohaensis]SSA38723.1 Metal-dependent hydrolase, endonuclease/exonuclease/phosphatase family [Jannaschia seohaensis]